MSIDNPVDNLCKETTAQQIFTYLAGRCGEDVAQEVVIRYLQAKEPVRFPLRWAWRKAMWLKMNRGRDETTRRAYEEAGAAVADPHPPDALRTLLAKEALAGRRECLWKRFQEDYQKVLQLRRVR